MVWRKISHTARLTARLPIHLSRCQVNGDGRVHLLNKTLLRSNDAPTGASIHLSEAGSVLYTLPAPPGRWLFVRQGRTFELKSGFENSNFPYACPAGVVGGPTPEEQSGPQCSRLWYAFAGIRKLHMTDHVSFNP